MPEAVGGEVAAEEGGNKWKGKNGGEPAEAGDSEGTEAERSVGGGTFI